VRRAHSTSANGSAKEHSLVSPCRPSISEQIGQSFECLGPLETAILSLCTSLQKSPVAFVNSVAHDNGYDVVPRWYSPCHFILRNVRGFEACMSLRSTLHVCTYCLCVLVERATHFRPQRSALAAQIVKIVVKLKCTSHTPLRLPPTVSLLNSGYDYGISHFALQMFSLPCCSQLPCTDTCHRIQTMDLSAHVILSVKACH
jgi:hypothetical protein